MDEQVSNTLVDYSRELVEVALAGLALIFLIMTLAHFILRKKSSDYEYGKLYKWLQFSHHGFAFFFGLFIIRGVFFENYKVPLDVMSPGLLSGDHILIKKFEYNLRIPFIQTPLMQMNTPHRGDIVVYESSAQKRILAFFRILGLPGEHIRVNRRTGEVYINDHVLPQSIAKHSIPDREKNMNIMEEDLGDKVILISKRERMTAKLGAWLPDQGRTIPKDKFFGIYDNRDACCDSREIGVISLDQIIGKAYAIYMSEHKTLRFDRNQFIR